MTLVPAALTDAVLAMAPLLDPVPDPEDVKPGLSALLLVVGLIVVTVLLWLSMRKQLGRIRFEEEPDEAEGSAAGDDDVEERRSSEPRRENGPGPV